MAYQLKRINPFWHANPILAVVVVIGAICAAVGLQSGKPIIAGIGGVLAGLAILFAARPVLSALLGALGLLGGLVTFVIVPNTNAQGLGIGMKLLSTGLFAVFYMVLMNALVLVISVLYNLFAVALGGLRFELDQVDDEDAAA